MVIARGNIKFIINSLQIIINDIQSKNGKVDIYLAYGLSKNKSRTSEELSAIQDVEKLISEFDIARVQLCEKYSAKDESGASILRDGKYVGLESNDGFKKELNDLMHLHKDSIDKVNNFLMEEVDIDFYKIPISSFPKEISMELFQALLPIIGD